MGWTRTHSSNPNHQGCEICISSPISRISPHIVGWVHWKWHYGIHLVRCRSASRFWFSSNIPMRNLSVSQTEVYYGRHRESDSYGWLKNKEMTGPHALWSLRWHKPLASKSLIKLINDMAKKAYAYTPWGLATRKTFGYPNEEIELSPRI